MSYWKTYGFPVIVTRCSNNYGPYQYPEKLIPLTFSRINNKQKVPIYGDGLQIRDWIHVDDHCSGILSALEHGKLGEVYNFGGNSELTNIECVKKIIKEMKPNEDFENHLSFVKDRPGHDRRYAIDSTKAFNQLDWQPKISFDEGIKNVISWYRENHDWVKTQLNSKTSSNGKRSIIKILILGANGQLGSAISNKLVHAEADVTSLTKNDCDVTNFNKVKDIITDNFFDCIINASAYTRVDEAESNPKIANLVNESAVANISNLLKGKKTLFIHFSTDYVFDGESRDAYKEHDTPKPINIYGLSKLNGEKAVIQSCKNYLIFRTSWVYSSYGTNFPNTILKNYKQNKALKVVDDQHGVPNHVDFISDSIFICMNKFLDMPDRQKQEVSGTYHISCTGQTSWYHFSKYLLKQYRKNITIIEIINLKQ